MGRCSGGAGRIGTGAWIRGGTGRQIETEEALSHGIVQVARQARPLLEYRKIMALRVEPGILYRDRSLTHDGP
jgi:hypothetical protein